MTLTTISNKPEACRMSEGKQEIYTLTTTVDTYEVIGTIGCSGFLGVTNTIAVTTNNLLFKFEYTRDGVVWHTSITDYPIAAAATEQLSAVRGALYYRVSVKPAAAGVHGSVTWYATFTKNVVDPAYRGAFAHEAITVTNAHAESLTQATWTGAFCARITVEDNPIRVRFDGTAPTTTTGHLLQSGDTMDIDFTADIFHFQAIATGGNATIRVTYSR